MRQKLKELQEANEAAAKEVEQARVVHESFVSRSGGTCAEILRFPGKFSNFSDLNNTFWDFKLESVSGATNKTAGGLLQESLQSGSY